MAQDYSPSLVTNGLAFCGDAAVPSTAAPPTNIGGAIACRLYDRVSDNNGTMYNANCVDFDGTDAYVTYGDVTWLDGLTTVSVSCWFYLDGDPPNAAGILVSKDNTLECVVKRSSGNEYSLSINNNHRVFASAPTPAYGEWIHVVYTWNSTGDVRKLYLNGALADTDTGGNQSGNSLANSGEGLAVGARANGTYEIDGKIADTKIFSKELSAANVKELYDDSKVIIPTKNDASGGFLSQTDLALWAPLTDGAGSYAYDGSGHGRDGTYTGTSFLTGQPGCPQLVEGYNRPMWFDGSNDVVQNGSPSFPTGAATRTIAGWVWSSVAAGGVFGYGTTSGSSNSIFEFYDYGAGGIRLHFGTYNSGGSTVLSSNTWYHLAATYDGTTAKVYINGVLDHTNTRTLVTGSDFARIGGNNWGSSAGTFFDGTINEVVFYNTALSLAQVQALAATGPNGGPLPPDPMSLSNSSDIVAYWRNDSNITWADRSGNGYTGTVVGSPDALLFKQGINGSKSMNEGRDNQGFPLKQKDVGAVGFANYIANTTTTGVPIGDTIVTSGGLNVGTSGGAGTFAISAWVNPEILGTGISRYIINKRTQNGHWPCWGLYVTSGGALVCVYSSTTYGQCLENYTTADGTIQENNWYNIVFVKPAGDYQVVKVYINGVNVDAPNTLAYGSHTTSTSVATSTQPAYIGRNLDGDNSTGTWRDPWVGQLGPIQVYTEALTSAQVKQNFEAQAQRFQVPRSIVTDGLVLRLDAGDPGSYPGSGTAWYDVSGNGRDFTLDGSGITYSASNGGIFTLADGGATQSAGTQASTSTISTVVMWIKSTDGQALFLDQATVSGSYYVGAYRSGNKEYYGTCGLSVSFTLDTVDKSNIYDYFPDGAWHMVEFKTVDLSAGVGWHTIGFNQYTGYTFGNGAIGKIMIYDRTLTPAESAQNFRVDRERFGI